ncbi:MAG: DUF349 domain-containing protein [Bacteroidota bacterium]
MLPEQELPDMTEKLDEEVNTENPTPQAEEADTSEATEQTSAVAEESPVAEATPSSEEESDADATTEEVSSPVVEEAEPPVDTAEAESTAEEAPSTEEVSEAPAAVEASETSEMPTAEGEVPTAKGAVEEETVQAASPEEAPKPFVLPESIPQDLWDRMEEILASENPSQQILSSANLGNLMDLLTFFTEDAQILKHTARFGIVKRTYDALKYQETFTEEQTQAYQEKLQAFNKRRVEAQKAVESQKRQNAEAKIELIAQLQAIVDTEDPLKIKEVRGVQDAWKEIGQVPRDKVDEIYKQYRTLLDIFYNRRGMHFEMLEYDRRINLAEKERLIKEAQGLVPPEELIEDVDTWKARMDLLSELQQQWKAVGHVPRDDMDRINNSYREAIDKFFEARQVFREKQDTNREANATIKEEILAKMAPFSEFTAERPKAWNEATRELQALQEAWKNSGQAPQAVNNDLWNRYRAICDAFFGKKAAFFKKFDEFRQENLSKKRELCEQAEAIAQSQEWEKSARELKRLQQEWKKIGPVPERHSNKLWNRFRAACDAFFEGRRAHYQELHKEEYENLDAKKRLIEEVKKLADAESTDIEGDIERVKAIQQEWKEIGKVPYKEKDKIWDEFRGEVDEFFNGLSSKRGKIRERRMNRSLETIADPKELSAAVKERIRILRRQISQVQEKVDQYSTNVQFISKGKSGDALRNQINKEIESEKNKIADLKRQIKELQEKAKNPPKKEAPVAEAPAEAEAPATPAPEAEPAAEVEASETPVVEAEPAEESAPTPEEAPVAEAEASAPDEAPAAEVEAPSEEKKEE